MLLNKPSFSDLIGHVKQWSTDEHGVRAELYDRTKQDGRKYTTTDLAPFDLAYTWEDVHAFEPRLIDILKYNDPMGDGYLVMALEYFHGPVLWLPKRDIHDNTEKPFFRVKYFESLENSVIEGEVIIRCQRFDLVGGKSCEKHPVQIISSRVRASRAWMDTHYPKWEERFNLGMTLELDPPTMTALVVDDARPPDATALPDLQFD